MLQALFDSVRTMRRDAMSPAVRRALEQEESRGAISANRFRYVFMLLILLLTFVTGETGLMWNVIGLALFSLVTVLHTTVLHWKPIHFLRKAYSYFAVVADFGVIYFSLFGWMRYYDETNLAFVAKNPGLWLLLLPMALALLQFRIRLIALGVVLFLVSYFGLLFFAIERGAPVATDWVEYILGPALLPVDVSRPIAVVALGLTLAYATYRAVRMVRRVARAESDRSSLARYFSPAIVDEITDQAADGLDFNKGRRQKVTVLFSDIRSFTRMSEGMSADVLVERLSRFRELMTRAIFAEGGTLDKYIGDAIMATFGTPQPSTEPGADSRAAVRAGTAMFRALLEFNRERTQEGESGWEMGIGIHCGEVFTGNVGFEDRLEYTVIGDAVNTASRIESLCKKMDAPFIVSDEVYRECSGVLDFEPLPRVKVKGKEEALRLWRVAI